MSFFKYSPAEKPTINTANSQVFINLPGKASVASVIYSLFNKGSYASSNDKKLNILGPIALLVHSVNVN